MGEEAGGDIRATEETCMHQLSNPYPLNEFTSNLGLLGGIFHLY